MQIRAAKRGGENGGCNEEQAVNLASSQLLVRGS
jgi:hypothetical protein